MQVFHKTLPGPAQVPLSVRELEPDRVRAMQAGETSNETGGSLAPALTWPNCITGNNSHVEFLKERLKQ